MSVCFECRRLLVIRTCVESVCAQDYCPSSLSNALASGCVDLAMWCVRNNDATVCEEALRVLHCRHGAGLHTHAMSLSSAGK
jgi:hypothetical protein